MGVSFDPEGKARLRRASNARLSPQEKAQRTGKGASVLSRGIQRRRGKFWPVRAKRIIEAITLGCSLEGAANAAGVAEVTLRRWMEAGQQGQEPFAKFYWDCKQAAGEAEMRWNAVIERAARETNMWQAAAWKLERKYPQHYGRRSPDIQILVQNLNDEELLRVAAHQRIGAQELAPDIIEGETPWATTPSVGAPTPDEEGS